MTRLRARLLPILVAIALVVVSAMLVKLTETDQGYQRVRGAVGETVVVNDGELTVLSVRFGSVLSVHGVESDRTDGLFAVVTVKAAATGRRALSLSQSRLVAESVTFGPFGLGSGVTADPGFVTTSDLVFEVDPDRIGGLRLELWPLELVSGYQQRAQLGLGLSRDEADRADAARGQVVAVGETDRRAIS